LIKDKDSIIFQQIDIREKYAVGKHPEFMMYGVTQVRLFAGPFPARRGSGDRGH